MSKSFLKKSIEKFNGLDQTKQNYIIKSIEHGRLVILNNFNNILTLDDISIFKEIKNCIVKTITEVGEKNLVIKKIKLAGLEEKYSLIFYEYCNNLVRPIADSNIIKMIDNNDLKEIIDFIIQKMFFYQDYKEYYPEYLINKTNFNNRAQIIKVLRFLYHIIFMVSSRQNSPEVVKARMLEELEFPEERLDIIFSSIKENINELHHAYLIMEFDSISSKISKIESFFDDLNENEDDDAEDTED